MDVCGQVCLDSEIYDARPFRNDDFQLIALEAAGFEVALKGLAYCFVELLGATGGIDGDFRRFVLSLAVGFREAVHLVVVEAVLRGSDSDIAADEVRRAVQWIDADL